ncbi:MAG: SIS domain-containing protein [Deltaproteobacteria bacterium]|nr:SIS domain-containing protein [Deltaproteobacteria bacterium]
MNQVSSDEMMPLKAGFEPEYELTNYFAESALAISQLKEEAAVIREMAEGIWNCRKRGGKVLIAGNGGSCADAEHFAGELVCTFSKRDRQPYSAISLTNNSSALTAWTNDFGFESYFDRQVLALGKAGDILFLITTGGGDPESGASMNLVSAANIATRNGMLVYAIAGKTGGLLSQISDKFIKVRSFSTAHIQEAHIAVIHAICLKLDQMESEGSHQPLADDIQQGGVGA